eukprot:8555795-Pyramimonas_sp.AAC.1
MPEQRWAVRSACHRGPKGGGGPRGAQKWRRLEGRSPSMGARGPRNGAPTGGPIGGSMARKGTVRHRAK